MNFLRYIFLILVIVCSTSIGFLLSKKYVDRVVELKNLSNLINILKNKIRFTHKPLGEVLEEIGNIKKGDKISNIFLRTANEIEKNTLKDAWNKVVDEEKKVLNLKNEDIEIIKQFGTTLGKGDIKGEISEIEEFNIILEAQIKKAEEEATKNEKMYKSLGTIIGLVIVIILF